MIVNSEIFKSVSVLIPSHGVRSLARFVSPDDGQISHVSVGSLPPLSTSSVCAFVRSVTCLTDDHRLAEEFSPSDAAHLVRRAPNKT